VLCNMKQRMNLMGMTGVACAATLLAGCGAQAAPDAFLVRDGKAQGVIVAPAKPSAVAREAVHELQYHLQRASGATLPVMDKKSADALPPDRVRIVIGEAALPQESFRVETRDN